jgi:hypothetical protein
METCGICARPLGESTLAGMHPECFAERLPRDAGVAAIRAGARAGAGARRLGRVCRWRVVGTKTGFMRAPWSASDPQGDPTTRGLIAVEGSSSSLSLVTGQLAPAMAAVSVPNPAVSVLLGIVLYQSG